MGHTSLTAELRLTSFTETVVRSYFPSIPTITMQLKANFEIKYKRFGASALLTRQSEATIECVF